MEKPVFQSLLLERGKTFSLRDVVTAAFRRRRLMGIVFVGVLAGAIAEAFLTPPKYVSEMKVLVKRERSDPTLSPTASGAPQPVVTEEDLNSEVELLKSRDLMDRVVA